MDVHTGLRACAAGDNGPPGQTKCRQETRGPGSSRRTLRFARSKPGGSSPLRCATCIACSPRRSSPRRTRHMDVDDRGFASSEGAPASCASAPRDAGRRKTARAGNPRVTAGVWGQMGADRDPRTLALRAFLGPCVPRTRGVFRSAFYMYLSARGSLSARPPVRPSCTCQSFLWRVSRPVSLVSAIAGSCQRCSRIGVPANSRRDGRTRRETIRVF